MKPAILVKPLAALVLTLILVTAPKTSINAQTLPAPPKGREGVARVEAARLDVENVRSNVFLTLVELDRARGGGPNRPEFKIFCDQLGKMQLVANAFAERAKEMERRGRAYFKDWESQVRTGKQAAGTYAERKRAYDAINRFMQDARTHFLDFTALMIQIKSLIEGGPTPSNVATSKGLFAKANWRCIDVQRALANIEIQLDRLAESFAKDQE